jgi:hypothetical protein
MRTVILDGQTLNPGDLSWDELKQYGEVEIYPRTPEGEVAARLSDADAVLTNYILGTAVPEPSNYALLIAGFVLLAATTRKTLRAAR